MLPDEVWLLVGDFCIRPWLVASLSRRHRTLLWRRHLTVHVDREDLPLALGRLLLLQHPGFCVQRLHIETQNIHDEDVQRIIPYLRDLRPAC